MRIHYLMHVPHEGAGFIATWARRSGHKISAIRIYKGESFPRLRDVDLLVIMGGPMNVDEEVKYPWLKKEKKFIRQAIRDGKFVLGICLGAQLIARSLGSRVFKNRHKELGWFPVTLTPQGMDCRYFRGMPGNPVVYHWHEDMFAIPKGAKRIAYSDACRNQGFTYADNVIGLQFHFEITPDYVSSWCRRAGEIKKSVYVQDISVMIELSKKYTAGSNRCMEKLLDNIEKLYSGKGFGD